MGTATQVSAPPEPGTPQATGTGDRRRRGIVATVVCAILVAVVSSGLGTLAWFGMLPWRGPLTESGYQPNGSITGMHIEPDTPRAFTDLWVYNTSRVDATLDGIRPIADLPYVHVTDAWFPADSHRCRVAALKAFVRETPADCKVPVSGYVMPAGTTSAEAPRLVVVLEADRPGTFRSPGFNVRYHVGPISYTSSYGEGFVLWVGRG